MSFDARVSDTSGTAEFVDTLEVFSGEEQVEQFLESNAALFAAVNTTWREAFATHIAYTDSTTEAGEAMVQTANRSQRRAASKNVQSLTDLMQYSTRDVAAKIAQYYVPLTGEEAPQPGQVPDTASITEFATQALTARGTTNSRIEFHLSDVFDTDSREKAEASFDAMLNATAPGYVVAEVYSQLALRRIAELVADPEVNNAFVNRLASIIDNSDISPEYPGLLELLATDLQKNNGESIVGKSLNGLRLDEQAVTREFVERIITDTESRGAVAQSKEVVAAYGVLKSVAKVLGVTAMTQEEFIDAYAQAIADWPKELLTAREQLLNYNRTAVTTGIKDGLRPYVRSRRILTDYNIRNAANKGGRHVIASKKSSRLVKHDVPQAKPGIETAESDKPPVKIENFAVLKGIGTKSNAFRLETVDSIDDMLTLPVITDYLKRYQHESTLADAIKASLQKLCVEPYDNLGSKLIVSFNFTLDSDGIGIKKRRQMRRFRPETIPEVHGEIARQTRIAYSIVTIGGKPTLALYQIENKQALAGSNNSNPFKR